MIEIFSGEFLGSNEPVTMASLRSKSAGDVVAGDFVMGWVHGEPEALPTALNGSSMGSYRKWQPSEVLKVRHRESKLLRVTTADGKSVLTTTEQRWYTGRSGELEYKPVATRKGRKMYRTRLESMSEGILTDHYRIGYIRGMMEGDGSWMPQAAWRIALLDHEALFRIKEYLTALGYECPEFKPFSKEGMLQIYLPNGHPANELVNGLDIESHDYWRGFLSGIYDAEGNTPARLDRAKQEALRICQVRSVNPMTYNRIERALRLFGFGFVAEPKAVRVFGGRLESARFIQLVQPVIQRKSNPISGSSFKGLVESHYVTGIEDAGHGLVTEITTTTGNYIAGGYLAKGMMKLAS